VVSRGPALRRLRCRATAPPVLPIHFSNALPLPHSPGYRRPARRQQRLLPVEERVARGMYRRHEGEAESGTVLYLPAWRAVGVGWDDPERVSQMRFVWYMLWYTIDIFPRARCRAHCSPPSEGPYTVWRVYATVNQAAGWSANRYAASPAANRVESRGLAVCV